MLDRLFRSDLVEHHFLESRGQMSHQQLPIGHDAVAHMRSMCPVEKLPFGCLESKSIPQDNGDISIGCAHRGMRNDKAGNMWAVQRQRLRIRHSRVGISNARRLIPALPSKGRKATIRSFAFKLNSSFRIQAQVRPRSRPPHRKGLRPKETGDRDRGTGIQHVHNQCQIALTDCGSDLRNNRIMLDDN